MEFSQIPSEKLPDVWLALLPYIEKALSYANGEQTIEDVYNDILFGNTQLWAVHLGTETQAVGVTRLVQFPKKKVCRVVLFSSDALDSMMHLWPRFEDWARAEGCQSIDWMGRPGFVKIMKANGYESKYTVMSKDITLSSTIH